MSVKKKFYLTLLSAGAILIAAGAGVALYLFLNITEASSDYVESQKELLTLQKKGVLIKEFERELESIQSDWPKIEAVFLREEDILGFVETLEKLAEKTKNRHSINIIGTPPAKAAPGEVKADEASSFFVFRINLWGSLSSVFDFLNYLENQPIYLSVEDIQLVRSEGGLAGFDKTAVPLAPGDVSAVLTIKVFAR